MVNKRPRKEKRDAKQAIHKAVHTGVNAKMPGKNATQRAAAKISDIPDRIGAKQEMLPDEKEWLVTCANHYLNDNKEKLQLGWPAVLELYNAHCYIMSDGTMDRQRYLRENPNSPAHPQITRIRKMVDGGKMAAARLNGYYNDFFKPHNPPALIDRVTKVRNRLADRKEKRAEKKTAGKKRKSDEKTQA